MDWKQEALKLKLEQNQSWHDITAYITEKYSEEFKDIPYNTSKDRIRGFIRNTDEYKELHKDDTNIPDKSSYEYKSDGSIISEKFITLKRGEEMTPLFILEAHGLNADLWEVVNYKNNFWNSQLKGGHLQISYQSKLTAKPIKKGLDLKNIEQHFNNLDRKYKTPEIKYEQKDNKLIAVVHIADLHFGKLCWRGDTGMNFDYKIARDMFFNIVARIYNELKDKPLEYILFVWSDDFFNSDTIDKTTTAGTKQDTDLRWQKLFNVGVEMLQMAIDLLLGIAPVRTFYTPSNHDELTSYHAIKYIEAWFRNDNNVTIDTDAQPRKYIAYGNTLLGFCHGCGISPKQLSGLMPIEARELWGQAKYCEMHTAHLHTEHVIEELNGIIVRRISSPTANDTWHKKQGYIGQVRKAQTFIYDKEQGLTQIINTPVMDREQ